MDIYEMIKKCKTDEELRELVADAIETFTRVAYEDNVRSDYIGTKLDINPVSSHFFDPSFTIDKYYDAVNVWNGYIPLGMKIVYGRYFNEKYKTYSHKGSYYYLDDDSYIFEFFKFLKDKEISDDYDLIIEVDCFMKQKFGNSINPKDRDEVNKLIYRDEDFFFRPVKEHSIRDFYHNGSAMCSELSIMAENLLSVLGLEVINIHDKGHAYNIYARHLDDETEIYVLDYSNFVGFYNYKFELVDTFPFFKKIPNCMLKDINEVANEGKRIILNDYYLYHINGVTYEITTTEERNYGVDFALDEEKSLILGRKQ